MSDTDTDGTELKHCPSCGSDGPFDGQGYYDRNFTRRSASTGFDATQIYQCWYQVHCPGCGAKFRLLETEEERENSERRSMSDV